MSKDDTHPQHELANSFASFSDYLKWRCDGHFRLQSTFVTSARGEPLVDFIGRYEPLDEDFAEVCRRIGIKAELPHLNISNTKPYWEYYTPQTAEMIATTFSADIERYGYRFEGSA